MDLILAGSKCQRWCAPTQRTSAVSEISFFLTQQHASSVEPTSTSVAHLLCSEQLAPHSSSDAVQIIDVKTLIWELEKNTHKNMFLSENLKKNMKHTKNFCGQSNYTTWIISFKRAQLTLQVLCNQHSIWLSPNVTVTQRPILSITVTLALRPVNSLLLIIYICDFSLATDVFLRWSDLTTRNVP